MRTSDGTDDSDASEPEIDAADDATLVSGEMLLTIFFVLAPPVPAPRACFSRGSWNKPPCFGFGLTRSEESAVATDPSMLSPASVESSVMFP